MSNDEKSLGDQHTFSGGRSDAHANRGPQSLGDQATYGDAASGGDAVFDDGMEVIDLSARYKIEGTLGQGGMGAVLLAIDTRLNRKVAIKRILGAAARSQTAVNRFLTEAQSIAALNHPNIVQIYDYGRAADGPFLIMEFVEGSSLLEKCEQGPLPLEEAVELTSQLCDGLGKAHAAGIIHRDIKPANVLLTADGAPKLTDFGLAKAETTEAAHTMVGAVLGTLDFMPPEQRRDAALTDHRSDLWSLAATLYQMVTGKSPKIIKFNDVPKSLQDVLGKALEDDKNDRYQSAKEFRDALTGALAGAGAAADLSQGECPGCGARNEASRKFCKGCGSKLEAQCLSCHAEIPLWEEFCGNCGTKQSDLLAERRQVLARQQSDAEKLLSDGSYDEAVAAAEKLKEEPDPRLRSIKQWAENFIGRIDAQKTAFRQQAEAALEEARKHFEAGDYTTAQKTLEQIHPVGATPETEAFTTEVRGVCDEITTLSQQIRQRIDAKEINGLLPIVDRYLELKPANTHIQELREKLVVRGEKQQRAQVEALEHARSLFEAGDEDGCLAYIESVPKDHESDELAQLLQGIVGRRERRRTIRENFRSKQYTGMLPLTESYLAENPADEELQQILQSLLERNKKLDVQLAQLLEAVEQARSTGGFGKAIALLGKVPEDRWDSTFSQLKADLHSLKSAREDVLQGLQNAQSLSQFTDAIQAANAYYTSFAEQTSEDATLASAVGVAKKQAAVLSRNRRIMRGVYATFATVAVVAASFGYFTYQRQQEVAQTVAIAMQRGRQAIASLDYSMAVAAFDDVLALKPDDAEALTLRADAKLSKDPPDAAGAARDLVSAEAAGAGFDLLKPRKELLSCVEAENLAASQAIDDADKTLRSLRSGNASGELVLRVERAIGAALLNRAKDAAATADTKSTIADLTRASTLHVPAQELQDARVESAEVLIKTAQTLLASGHVEEAIVVADTARQLDQNNNDIPALLADSYINVSRTALAAGDQDKASAAFLNARRASPSVAGLTDLAVTLADRLVQRAESSFSDAAYQEAVAAVATISESDPTKAEIQVLQNRLGKVLLAEADNAINAGNVDRTVGIVSAIAALNVLPDEQSRLLNAAASLLFGQAEDQISKEQVEEAARSLAKIEEMPVPKEQKARAMETLMKELEPVIAKGLQPPPSASVLAAVTTLPETVPFSPGFIEHVATLPETVVELLPDRLRRATRGSYALTKTITYDAAIGRGLAISGKLLAFQQPTGRDGEVVVYNLTNQRESRITCPDKQHDNPAFGSSLAFISESQLFVGAPLSWISQPHDGVGYIYDLSNFEMPGQVDRFQHKPPQRGGAFGVRTFAVSRGSIVIYDWVSDRNLGNDRGPRNLRFSPEGKSVGDQVPVHSSLKYHRAAHVKGAIVVVAEGDGKSPLRLVEYDLAAASPSARNVGVVQDNSEPAQMPMFVTENWLVVPVRAVGDGHSLRVFHRTPEATYTESTSLPMLKDEHYAVQDGMLFMTTRGPNSENAISGEIRIFDLVNSGSLIGNLPRSESPNVTVHGDYIWSTGEHIVVRDAVSQNNSLRLFRPRAAPGPREASAALARAKGSRDWINGGDLLAHYRLDGDASDASGYGADGDHENTEAAADRFGTPGKAMRFHGRPDSFAQLPFQHSMLDEITLCCWVQVQESATPTSRWPSGVLSVPKADKDSFPGSGLQMQVNVSRDGGSAGGVRLDAMDNSGGRGWPYVQLKRSVCDGEFHHWIAVVGGGKIQLYVDGVKADETAYNATETPRGTIELGRLFHKNTNGGANPAQACVLDDVRVYSRVLTAAEIKELYEYELLVPSSASGTYTMPSGLGQNINPDRLNVGLLAHFRLDGDVDDERGSNKHGTVIGEAEWGANRFGVMGKAFRLRPDGRQLKFDLHHVLRKANSYTLTGWLKVAKHVGPHNSFFVVKGNGVGREDCGSFGIGLACPTADGFGGRLKMGAGVTCEGGSNSASERPIPLGEWIHAACVWDGDCSLLFVDGVQMSRGDSVSRVARDVAGFLIIGNGLRNGDGLPNSALADGFVDDIRLYSRALTGDEIKVLYERESVGDF